MDKKKRNKTLLAIGGVALTVVGLITIPPIIDKYGNMIYKASLKNEEIDFDDMGPEIVRRKSE